MQSSNMASKESSMGIIAAITISGIAAVCLVLLCILLLVLKKRHDRPLRNRRCRPVTETYSMDSISIYSSFLKKKLGSSKRSYLNQGFEDPDCPSSRINFAGLANLSHDQKNLAEEFKRIPVVKINYDDLPPGAELKNRYANIIPVPETRVHLISKTVDPASDYINANFVRGFRNESKKYIACQGPLSDTIVDFWRMVWEQQVKVIIMLTDFEENGQPKCAPYFPESDTVDFHRLYGDFQISNKRRDVRLDFTVTTLQLRNLEKNLLREVVHFWYTAWPSRTVPTDPSSLLDFLLEARPHVRINPGPTVVHCSTGTGRTGTVMAIDICMQEFEYSRVVDIPKCIYQIRRDRAECVQSKEQYFIIYEVLNEYAVRLMTSSIRSSLQSSYRLSVRPSMRRSSDVSKY